MSGKISKEDIDRLYEEIRRVHDNMNVFNELPRAFGEEDVFNSTQAIILVSIYEKPGCIAQEISTKMGLTKGYISQELKKMEENGYIVRAGDAENKKIKTINLTDKGREFCEGFHRYLDSVHERQALEFNGSFTTEEFTLILKFLNFYNDLVLKGITSRKMSYEIWKEMN